MRLASIVINVKGHKLASLRSRIGKRVVVAALQVSARAEIVQVEVVRMDESRINWARVVVGSYRFTLRMGVLGVPMLVAMRSATR